MSTAKPGMPALIVVEDNETLRDELVLFLSEEGFDVRGVDSGEELNKALQAQHADILILDLNLPAEDGIAITRRIRRSLPKLGIIILRARVRGTDRLEGYTTGADVYLTKPTRPDELAAVVRNLFGRIGSAVTPVRWQLDMTGLTLHSPTGADIRLTGSEALLLKAMALNGQFMDHSALMAQFGDMCLSEKINKARIEVLISRLRVKLGHYIGEGFDIKALRGRGYQLGFSLVVTNLNSSQKAVAAALLNQTLCFRGCMGGKVFNCCVGVWQLHTFSEGWSGIYAKYLTIWSNSWAVTSSRCEAFQAA